MPAPTPDQLGPLAGLAGIWEGSKGLDVSYHQVEGEIGDTPYRERVTLSPFGPAEAGATTFTLKSELGSQTFGVLENPYLARNSSTKAFEITITVGRDTWSYEETTTVDVKRLGTVMAHTDGNALTRVAD